MPPRPSRPAIRWRQPAVIILVVLCAYWNSFTGPFIYDDILSIPQNNSIRRLWPPWSALSPPGNDITVAGRPLLNLSFAINYAISGAAVWSYHAANLLIHLAAALLALGVVRRTLLLMGGAGCGEPGHREFNERRADSIGLAAALLWAVHPLQTASVTYVVQRAESLMGLFFLATLYCVIRGAAPPSPTSPLTPLTHLSPSRRARWYALACAACALGMASKEVMAAAPFIVLLYDRAFLSPSFRESLRRRWPLHAALFSTGLIIVFFSLGARAATVGAGVRGIGPLDYALTQTHVILHYIRLCFWPYPLVFDYYWRIAEWNAASLPRAVPMVALAGGTVWLWMRHKALGFAAASFFAILAPSSSFVPIATEVAAEHRMYLPLLAPMALAAAGLHWLAHGCSNSTGSSNSASNSARARWVFRVCVAAATAAFVILTARRNADYCSGISIWEKTIADHPTSRAYINLALAYNEQRRYEDAGTIYRKLLETNPSDAESHKGLGVMLLQMGRHEQSIGEFEAALKLRPHYAEAHLNLAAALAAVQRKDEAIEHCREAIASQPSYAMAHYNLAVLLHGKGLKEEARKHFDLAHHYDPGFTANRYTGVETEKKTDGPAKRNTP